MDHDRLFKQLLQIYFAEFLELFLPAVAESIEPGSVTLLDKEIFTDLARSRCSRTTSRCGRNPIGTT